MTTPGDDPAVPLTLGADAVLNELRRDCGDGGLRIPRAATLLGERVALRGSRQGRAVAAGGGCRLTAARDGMVAIGLSRADDWELVPAWLEVPVAPEDWRAVAAAIASRAADDLVARARLIGLASARADGSPPPATAAWQVTALGRHAPPCRARPIVLDMSALWAGPLCGHLLACMGAEVIKLESPARIDGARRGNAQFYGLLNQGKRCVAIDPATSAGIAALRALIATADIVIESTRPRALRQWGICAERLVEAQAGLTWIAISAHGRGVPEEDWIGYGDDAGAAAGLSAALHAATGAWAFLGDAIADPITGIHAASAAWRGWRNGGGGLVSLALERCASLALAQERAAWGPAFAARLTAWRDAQSDPLPPTPPPRRTMWPVRAVGADNAAILGALPC